MMKVICPHCKAEVKINKPEASGRYAYKCTSCGKPFAVDIESEVAAEKTEADKHTAIVAKVEAKTAANATKVDDKIAANVTKQVNPVKGHVLLLFQKRMLRSDIEYRLKLGENTIGRESDKQPSTIMIDDKFMSRRAAKIVVEMAHDNTFKYNFQLLHATNPCHFNGKEIMEGTSLFLSDGDKFQLGKTTFYIKKKEE